MNDTLKVAGRIGAELGAAKAENEKLRGLLCLVAKRVRNGSAVDRIILERIDAALAQQAEPVAPALEQDEREVARTAPDRIYLVIGEECPADASFHELADVTWCEDDIDGNGIEYLRRVEHHG